MNPIYVICFLCLHFVNAKSDQECSKTICYPTAGDLLIGRESMLRASSTCGLEGSERYCVVTLTDRGRDSKCSSCDSRHPYNLFSSPESHRIENVVSRLPQDSDRWWQSSNGINNVSIEVEFVTEFQFIFTQLRFKTYRPAAMYIERSKDYGRSWQKSAYFSDNCGHDFPSVPERKRNDIEEVTCTSEFSSISPSEGGTILFVATPSDLHTNDKDWVTKKNEITAITNLRVHFVRLHTFGDWKIDNNPSILNKYHYAMSEWIIRGRCSCYGHAEVCQPKQGEISLKEMVYGVCVCRHNTIGQNCERCKDFYNDLPWMPAENNASNECKKCQCNNHSTTCHFDSVIFELSDRKSGGKCDNCIHNTEGINCQRCASGYYRNSLVNISSPDTCLKCKCDNHGTKFPGLCNQEAELDQNIIAGSCSCKLNVAGFYCDRCKTGYWNFDKNDEKGCTKCNCLMSGTVNNEACDQQTGDCLCKTFVEGKLCNICKDGYYNISVSNKFGCTPCRCNPRGSINSGKCDRSSGQCKCKQGYVGQMCADIKDGWFTISPKYPLKHKDNMQIELPPVSESGLYNFIITFDTQHIKIRDTYISILTIDHRTKTSCQGYEDTIYIRKDTKNIIVTNKCLIKDLTIVLNVFLFVDPTEGSKKPVITDVKVIPNLALNSTETKRALDDCLKYPANEMPPRCDFLNLDYGKRLKAREDPMACNCNVTGSRSHICNKLEGQCECMPNVVGRQCNQCQRNFYGFDALGCKNCSCDPTGSLNLQCAPDTGKCLCRVGVEGRHCDYCKAGFWRFPFCDSCKCNSMADICDSKTGQCKNCRGDSSGFSCQLCKTGYYGDPTRSVPCLKCNCPGLSMNLNHSISCSLTANATNYICHCKSGYKGQFCEECAENYFGNPREKNGRCSPCLCSSNINKMVSGNCDVRTGECKKCLYNTDGFNCEKCVAGYFGNGVSRTCKKCVCNQLGTNTSAPEICQHQTGNCPCLPNVFGQQCDQCQLGFYNISSGVGCLPCQCDSRNGALNETCNHLSGQCHCRRSRGGRQCDKCQDGYWGNPRLQDGCQVCLCDNVGSLFNQCDRNNGACRCKPGITGTYCDKCARGTDGEMPNCKPCGDCWKQWDQIIEQLSVLVIEMGNGTIENVKTPGFPKTMFVILDKIKLMMKNIPDDMDSRIAQLHRDIKRLEDELKQLKQAKFNGTLQDIDSITKSIVIMNDRVSRNRIKDSGGAQSTIVKSVALILNYLNETLEAMKTIERMKSITSSQGNKITELNLEKLDNKSRQLTDFENILTKNLQKFNKLTCNAGDNDTPVACSTKCDGIGCQPNNCSRYGKINEQCLKDGTPSFFNAYVWKIGKVNVSKINLDKFPISYVKSFNDTITKAKAEVDSTKQLIGVTDSKINSTYDQVVQLLVKLRITINSSASEFDFKKLLDAIRNFTFANHKEEIKRLEMDIQQRIQTLGDTVDQVMNKSKSNRVECEELRQTALQTKENANNLLKSIKDLEDNNKEILKIQSDTKAIITKWNDDESVIKAEFNNVKEIQNKTRDNHILIDKIIFFLKDLNNNIEKSVKAVQKDLDLLEFDQVKIKMKLHSIKTKSDNLFQKGKTLTEDTSKIENNFEDKRQVMLEKIIKINNEITKTREKFAEAKRLVTKKQADLKILTQNVEDKLQRITRLEYEIHAKAEFQSTCLP